jgi:hypothetical protein
MCCRQGTLSTSSLHLNPHALVAPSSTPAHALGCCSSFAAAARLLPAPHHRLTPRRGTPVVPFPIKGTRTCSLKIAQNCSKYLRAAGPVHPELQEDSDLLFSELETLQQKKSECRLQFRVDRPQRQVIIYLFLIFKFRSGVCAWLLGGNGVSGEAIVSVFWAICACKCSLPLAPSKIYKFLPPPPHLHPPTHHPAQPPNKINHICPPTPTKK